MMGLPEFEDLLGRLGDDLANWPASEQQAASALLGRSEQARSALAEAQRLRHALRSEPVRAPAGLTDRILRRAKQMEQQPPSATEQDPDDNRPAPLVLPG
jgi:hypothetical protein